MKAAEMKEAMKGGVDRYRHVKTGRVFALDPAQWRLLAEYDDDAVLLIGFPIKPSIRQRGRKWQWLAPKNLELAADAAKEE